MAEYQLRLKTNADASALDELLDKLEQITDLEEETNNITLKPDVDSGEIESLVNELVEVKEIANKPITPQIKTAGLTQGIANFGTKASQVANNVGSRFEKLGSKFDNLSSSMGGLLASIGFAEMATEAWEGATEKQTNQLLLARKYGADTAATMVSGINDVVKSTPGDDAFLTSMLSNASLQAKMTTNDYKEMADSIADYTVMSKAAGSSTFEAQGEIRNYLMTGETGRMKDTALAPYLDELESADTVTERVQILNKALKELGYSGAAGMGSAANSMETFKGTIQAALTSVGTAFLPIIQSLLDHFLALDNALGGNLSKALVVVGGGLAAFVAGVGALGAVLPAIGTGIKAIGTGIDVITKGPQIIKGLVKGFQSFREVITLVSEAETLSEGINVAYTASLGAEAAAADGAGASTGFFASVEWAALVPILLVIGAIIALVAILWYLYNNNEQVRQAVDNLITSIQGLIGEFINALQPIITFVQNGIAYLMTFLPAVQAIFGAVFNFIMNIFAMIFISAFNSVTRIVNTIRIVFNLLRPIVQSIFTGVYNIIMSAVNLWNNATSKAREIVNGITSAFNTVSGSIKSALGGVYDTITAPFQNAYNTLKPIIDSLKQAWDWMNSLGGGGSSGVVTGSSGIVMGSAGIVSGGTSNLGNANSTLMKRVNNNVGGTTNINLSGIIEESAGDFIVRKINDKLYEERITRGL